MTLFPKNIVSAASLPLPCSFLRTARTLSSIISVVLYPLKGFVSGPETSRCTFLLSPWKATFSPTVHPPLTALTFTHSPALVISQECTENGTSHRCIHAESKLTKDREKSWTQKWKWQLCCKIDVHVERGGNSRLWWIVSGLFLAEAQVKAATMVSHSLSQTVRLSSLVTLSYTLKETWLWWE